MQTFWPLSHVPQFESERYDCSTETYLKCQMLETVECWAIYLFSFILIHIQIVPKLSLRYTLYARTKAIIWLSYFHMVLCKGCTIRWWKCLLWHARSVSGSDNPTCTEMNNWFPKSTVLLHIKVWAANLNQKIILWTNCCKLTLLSMLYHIKNV